MIAKCAIKKVDSLRNYQSVFGTLTSINHYKCNKLREHLSKGFSIPRMCVKMGNARKGLAVNVPKGPLQNMFEQNDKW